MPCELCTTSSKIYKIMQYCNSQTDPCISEGTCLSNIQNEESLHAKTKRQFSCVGGKIF
jgi:hypothetical protein